MRKLFCIITSYIIMCSNHAFADNNVLFSALNIESRIPTSESLTRPYCFDKTRCNTIMVNKLYAKVNYQPVWITNNTPNNLALQFIAVLNKADSQGLNPTYYNLDQINRMIIQLNNIQPDNPQLSTLLTDFEVSMTNAYLLYLSNLAFGRIDNRTLYPNWNIKKREFDILQLFLDSIQKGDTNYAINYVTPKYIGYTQLIEQLHKYQQIERSGGFETIPSGKTLRLGSKGKRVILLNQRLNITGELDNLTNSDIFNHNTKSAVIKFQRNNGLNPTGIVDKNTLKLLNTPINQLIQTIAINIDRMRWLPDDLGNEYILVDIPSFSLDIFNNNQIIMSMPIIVGKEGNRSCILNSAISYMEVNPYWNIPRSIAVKDILPKLYESPNYLEQKNILVYNGTPESKNLVNPNNVNWKSLSAQNFNYTLRQEPGEQNALGKIKFIFPNECGIYLHDTPEQQLFKNRKRDYSHGCIRIAKPIELATYLLRNKTDAYEYIESQINSGKRKVIMLKEHPMVHVVYFTAWVNESGVLQFRPDIYKLDNVNVRLTQ